MFHVAACPTLQQQPYDMYQHQHAAAPLLDLQFPRFPRTRNRPVFVEVQRDAILAMEPNLEQIPSEYTRKCLHVRGEELMASLNAAKVPPQLPRARLPASFDTMPMYGASPPAHILAVHSNSSSEHLVSDAVFLVAMHHIVLVTRTPPVPQAEAFAALHAFLVAHRANQLVGALLPVMPAPARAGAGERQRRGGVGAAGDKMSVLMALTRFHGGVAVPLSAMNVVTAGTY
ncbi:hypothetical protein BC834DRAFT_843616 [Gloeopeniophorella convolvens]|nr:hypothetical protein BC834DRAFT_843616 [Gloeopeniophorella convolvens]